MKDKSNRRKFIQKAAMLAVGTAAIPSVLADRKTVNILRPNSKLGEAEELNIALIGAGGMGVADTKTALEHEGIKLVAVCDLYTGRLDNAKKMWGEDVMVTDKYEDILKRKDVDAVIIGTPDHWHKQISIDAMAAGKHVYCEKPMVQSVNEGHELIDAWKKAGVVYQVGSQGMSSLGNEKAKQLLAEGAIGDLNYAEGFWARHSPQGAWQYPIPADGDEKSVNWKRYISNTTDRPFDAKRFFRWRNYTDYGTGMAGDLFVHLFSSLHFISNSKGPNKISAMGGLRYWKDEREVPDVLLGMFQYPEASEHPGFNLSLRCNFVDGTSGTTYLKLVGSEGSMDVKWREVVLKRNVRQSSDDPFMKEKMGDPDQAYSDRKKMLGPQEIVYKAEDGYNGAHYDHFANFFNAIRTGGTVAEDPIFGFRAAAPALLCNDSYAKDSFVKWDPVAMKIIK